NAVYLVGDFNNWGLHSTPLFKTEEGWSTKIELGPGQYVYKYIVDGWWTSDPSTPEAELVKDGQGHAGLTIKIVK
ncbi:MAG: glycogen-binding domain-containing protein, partial [Mameliella sp.]|nr:glycogen-binding domain-containing protein [Phaeodactylibacter sp.]